MRLIRKIIQLLFHTSDTGFSQEWMDSLRYDKSGWEGPSFTGKFRR